MLLLRGAGAAGYATELWTLRRISEVIRKRFGVRYSPVGVWALVAAWPAVELAEAGTARPPARRGGHRPVEAERMAAVKKRRAPGRPSRIPRRKRLSPDPQRAQDLGARRTHSVPAA